MSHPIPLSLYIHIPWCVHKCPYCDFNSHAVNETLPEAAYVQALLADLALDAALLQGREIQSIFMGGGTPSIFSPDSIKTLIQGVRARAPLAENCEITMEANPGTVDNARFHGFREAGVNRLSLGIQSFHDVALDKLGRIHDAATAIRAIESAKSAGFQNFNLDLMFGLPGQNLEAALEDLQTALSFSPPHLSWYQLTLEPNTAFYHQPPPALPEDDVLWDIQLAGQQLLSDAGLCQYEISAYSQMGKNCSHNLNYWLFGDYLGIGAGAHGKISLFSADDNAPALTQIYRYNRLRHPRQYLKSTPEQRIKRNPALKPEELPIEFMMNALRLSGGFQESLWQMRTGQSLPMIAPLLRENQARGWLQWHNGMIQATPAGFQFLNELLESFIIDDYAIFL
ncbi:radical SAM family heme chaperone HemW [Candidatus Venteria ishoeyi]|uniref:radical SAM family heme chaperone HemW n=1 Tax=Candidatus Venteria ishoeyi TaxID=1899563 RepID=UPI0025A5A568|nr:radical SAM family heme chaperone HemW [Candidatus Venteria ishoeyi]MDM8548080.1 radical SAM family heme chaperone HemW [Candidatus Venteria ishoeyi]